MTRVASFTYFGSEPSKNRTVRLYQNQSGTYTVDVEGYPSLTQTTPDERKAESVFLGWRGMASKDWGASEIDWNGWTPILIDEEY